MPIRAGSLARWLAGFARGDDLDVFKRTGCRTDWQDPCLVIVDYAAAKTSALWAWLGRLVQQEGERPQFRLLLIERTGGPTASWWRQIFDQGGLEGNAVEDLLAAGAPVTLGAFGSAAERYAVFAAAFGQAQTGSVPAASEDLDRTLQNVSLGGEPLFLAMFGLVVARQGVGQAAALTADKVARDLAKQELGRISKHWTADD